MDIDARSYHGSLASVGFSATILDNQYDESPLDKTISVLRNTSQLSYEDLHRNETDLQKYLKNPQQKFDLFDLNVPNYVFTNIQNEVVPCALTAPTRLREELDRNIERMQETERARVDLIIRMIQERNGTECNRDKIILFLYDLFNRDVAMTELEEQPIVHDQDEGYKEEFLEYPICGDSCCSCKERLYTRLNPLYRHPAARNQPMTQYSMHPSVFGISAMCGFTVAAPGRLLKLSEDGFALNSKEHFLVSRQKEYAEWRYGIVQQSSLVRTLCKEKSMNTDNTPDDQNHDQSKDDLVPEDWDEDYMQDTMYNIGNSNITNSSTNNTMLDTKRNVSSPLASPPPVPETCVEPDMLNVSISTTSLNQSNCKDDKFVNLCIHTKENMDAYPEEEDEDHADDQQLLEEDDMVMNEVEEDTSSNNTNTNNNNNTNNESIPDTNTNNAMDDIWLMLGSSVSTQPTEPIPIYTSDIEAEEEDLVDSSDHEDEEEDLEEEELVPLTHEEKMSLCEQVWTEQDQEEKEDKHSYQRVPFTMKRNNLAGFLRKFHIGIDNVLQFEHLPDFGFGDVDDSAGLYLTVETMHLRLARAGKPNVAVQPYSPSERFLGDLGSLRFWLLFNDITSVVDALCAWDGEMYTDIQYRIEDATFLKVLKMVANDEKTKREQYLAGQRNVQVLSSTIERQPDQHDLQQQTSMTPVEVVHGTPRAVLMHRFYHHCRALGLSSVDADSRWRTLLSLSNNPLAMYEELCHLDTERYQSSDKLILDTTEDVVNQYFMDYVTIYGTKIGMKVLKLFGVTLPVPKQHLPLVVA